MRPKRNKQGEASSGRHSLHGNGLKPVYSSCRNHGVPTGHYATLSRDPVKAVQLTRWYQNLMTLGMPILETGKEVAEAWGTLAADPKLRNLIVSHPGAKRLRHGQDLHVAAAALVHRTPIATFNTRDFLLIHTCYPLPGIYNPQTDTWHTANPLEASREKIGTD